MISIGRVLTRLPYLWSVHSLTRGESVAKKMGQFVPTSLFASLREHFRTLSQLILSFWIFFTVVFFFSSKVDPKNPVLMCTEIYLRFCNPKDSSFCFTMLTKLPGSVNRNLHTTPERRSMKFSFLAGEDNPRALRPFPIHGSFIQCIMLPTESDRVICVILLLSKYCSFA